MHKDFSEHQNQKQMKNSELIDDNIDQLKECPKCNYYYTDGMPFSLVGKPFKNGIRAKYTNFKCRGCNTEFISFTNYDKVREAEENTFRNPLIFVKTF